MRIVDNTIAQKRAMHILSVVGTMPAMEWMETVHDKTRVYLAQQGLTEVVDVVEDDDTRIDVHVTLTPEGVIALIEGKHYQHKSAA